MGKKYHYGIVGLGPVGAIFAVLLKRQGHRVSILESNQVKVSQFEKEPLMLKGAISSEGMVGDIFSELDLFVESEPEVVLICTKSSSTLGFLKNLKGFPASKKMVFVSCQNGINVEDLVGQVFGEEHSLRMVLNFGCNFVSRNEVYVSFCFDHFLSQKRVDHISLGQLVADLNQAGLSVSLTEKYKEEAFKKAILNCALGPVCALTRMTMSQVMTEPELLRMVKQIVRESIMVGEGLGYNLTGFFDFALKYLASGGNHKPSMAVDIENRRVTENEFHCGQLFRYAEELKIEVPVIQTVYYLVKNLERSLIMESFIVERKV